MSYYENLLVGEFNPVTRHLASEVFSGAGFVDAASYVPGSNKRGTSGPAEGSMPASPDDVFVILDRSHALDSLICSSLWLVDTWGGECSSSKKLTMFGHMLDVLEATARECEINVLAPDHMCARIADAIEGRGLSAKYYHIPEVVIHGQLLQTSSCVITDIVRQVAFASLVSRTNDGAMTLSVPTEKKIGFCDSKHLAGKVSEMRSVDGLRDTFIPPQALLAITNLVSLVSDSLSLGPVSVSPASAYVHTPIEMIFSKNIRTICDLFNDYTDVDTHNPCFYKEVIDKVAGFSREFPQSLLVSDSASVFDRVEVESWDGYRINLYTLGSPDKPPLLLVNAYGMPVTFMEPLAQALSDAFYVVTWESRGIPSDASGVDGHDLSPSAHARDGIYIMDLLTLKKSDVLGWCTGAHVALKMALLSRERVGRLILLNGGFNFDNIQDTAFQRNMRHVMVAASGNIALARLYHSAMYSRSENHPSTGVPDASEKTLDIFRSTDTSLVHLTGTPYRSPENLFKYASMIARFIQDKDYSGIEELGEDVLILSAKDDVTTGYMGSVYLNNCIQGSRISFPPAGDHFLLYNDSQYVCNQVRAFLSPGHGV